MDRRTFVLLTGASSAALIRPPDRLSDSPPWAVGRLRFELDDHRRWSLWYYGDGSPVPVVRGAEIVAWGGDQPLTLAELERSEEHTSELQSRGHLVCRLLLEKKN